ncbi:hypothetical protein MOV08_05260 [Streptomyces yunnanensis]|uniref:PKD domain-containing protein n=1 Tax=Streptomyces yunnanensis TaxID=156453 RepID=A0ABY8A1E8_9ACTN|nr:hypothetical protein [Streptomyces yunnanensis]WEB38769.1 hypothetical protein MOV08_05260 [Streptomyces yunnanensis]
MPSFDAPNGQGSEYSWPFSDGKGTAVDQAKWQDMAARMTYTAVSGKLGDAALQVSVSKAGTPPSVDVAPGEAMVRGFCYKTDGVSVQLKDNSRTPQPRLDTIVLRLDMANNNISATSLMGAPAEDPKPAELKREQGGVWDFPIAYVLLKKSSNEIAEIADLRIFSDGGNLPQAYDPSKADVEPNPGDLLFMREAKSGYESFVSYSNRGGWAVNEDIGKYRTYKPNLNYASVDSPKPEIKGHWKWIAQNTVYFCANITNNDNTRNIVAGGQQTYMNVDLPVKARGGHVPARERDPVQQLRPCRE